MMVVHVTAQRMYPIKLLFGTSKFPVLKSLVLTDVSKGLPESDHSKHLRNSSSKFICEVYMVLVDACENSCMHYALLIHLPSCTW